MYPQMYLVTSTRDFSSSAFHPVNVDIALLIATGFMKPEVVFLERSILFQTTTFTNSSHIKYYLKTETNNILDTKIASKLARSYSDNHSLKTLIKEFLNVDISKQFQSSDFGGDLTQAQLKYCANDVIYLHKIHMELNKILEREKRIDLYKNCLKFLKTRVDLDLALFKDDIWSH